MKKMYILTAMLLLANFMFATVILVDQNGAGQYSTIQAAISAANAGDTVRVWPGTYMEQITLNKNILLQGSGYENSIITGSFNPTITITTGIMQWFQISSTGGYGVQITGGKIRNCVVKGCSNVGIYISTGTCYIENCTILNNGGTAGVWQAAGTAYVVNCISRLNSAQGYENVTLTYSNGSTYGTSNNQGIINSDPFFTSTSDYHISQGSPCWNTGNPSLSDPDGTVSDMGYFGGPNCPIYPVVYEIQITPNGSNINLQAKGRANY